MSLLLISQWRHKSFVFTMYYHTKLLELSILSQLDYYKFTSYPQSTVLQMLSAIRYTDPNANMDIIVVLLLSVWKTWNGTVFRKEPPNPGMTLIRAEKASAEWRIRHKLTNNIHPPNPNLLTFSRKQIHWVAWRKPLGWFIKINFDGFKSSQGSAGGFIIRSWDGKLSKFWHLTWVRRQFG